MIKTVKVNEDKIKVYLFDFFVDISFWIFNLINDVDGS